MKRPAKQNVGFPITTVSVLCCCPVLKPWKWKRRVLFQTRLGSAHPWWYYLGPRYMVTTKAENPPTKCTTYSEQKTNLKKTNFWEIELDQLPHSHSQFLQVASASRPDWRAKKQGWHRWSRWRPSTPGRSWSSPWGCLEGTEGDLSAIAPETREVLRAQRERW